MSESSQGPQVPAGWYPDPNMAGTKRYWDGVTWTDNVAPADAAVAAPERSGSGPSTAQILIVVLIAAAVIGVIMAMQSASVISGTGTQWTGTAITIAAAIAAWILRKSIPLWVRIVLVIAAVLALVNVIYLEHEISQRRHAIENSLNF